MKLIRTFLLSLVVLLGATKLYPADMISELVMQDGSGYSFNHVFENDGALCFALKDGAPVGRWSCALKLEDGVYAEVPSSTVGGECFYNPTETSWGAWKNAMREYDEQRNQELFMLRVSFRTDEGIEDSRELKLALLPTNPEFEVVDFVYTYNWDEDYIELGAEFSFSVNTIGAKYLELYQTLGNEFEPGWFGIRATLNISDPIHIMDYDWGTFIKVSAGNEFGWVYSDIICTTDYITDAAVLQRIEELRTQASIDQVSTDLSSSDVKIQWHDNHLVFSDRVSKAALYSIDGRLCCQWADTQDIDVLEFSSGMYIVVYSPEKDSSKIYQYKFSKK